jgi:hypothetical protein
MTHVGDYYESVGTSGDPEVAGRLGRKIGQTILKAHTAPFRLVMGFDNGQLVGHAPEVGAIDGVDLRAHARRMARRGEIVASGELEEYLGSLGGPPEVSGKIAQKVKAVTKKAATKVVKSATAVVKSKVVKGIYNTVKAAVPQPFKAGITVAQKGVQFAKKAAKKGSKESKAAPLVNKLAANKITPAQATVAAKKAGVDPEDIKAAALTVAMKTAADNGDQGAQTVVEAVEKIESAESSNDPTAAISFGAEAKIRRDYPDAQIMTVTDANGRKRLTAVIPIG